MKNLLTYIGLTLAIALHSAAANAIPTLFFDGDFSYDSATGLLAVDSHLTATEDIASLPALLGSSLTFSALFSSVDTSNPSATVGLFTGVDGNDLKILDGNSIELLFGNFSELQMIGANGRDRGVVTGNIDATGGSLASLFNPSTLFALELNLSTTFSDEMFLSSFQGNIDGRIIGSVPEPKIIVLLGLGLALMGLLQVTSKKHRLRHPAIK